jgi:hypothetical protein
VPVTPPRRSLRIQGLGADTELSPTSTAYVEDMLAEEPKDVIRLHLVPRYGKGAMIGWLIFAMCTLLRVDIITQILITIAFFSYLEIFD